MDKPKETFFSQLRQIAVKVERECDQYKQALTQTNEDVCTAQAIKVISDWKNDVKSFKVPLQTEREKQKKEREKLEDISAAIDSFLNKPVSKQFSELEQYFGQYGYKPYEEEQRTKTEQTVTEEEESEDNPEDTAVPKTPPAIKPPQDPNRTPRLEDAGISLDTLQYLNSLQKNRPPANRPVSHKPSWSNIPSEFQHNGIICTPSLAKSLNADISYSTDLHSALASPVLLSAVKSMPVIEEAHPAPSECLQFKTHETNSPASPVFCTPGIKQILTNTHSKHDNSSQARDSNKRPVNVGLFQSGETNKTVKSAQLEPKVPDLRVRYDDDEPVEPELTYSLEALTDMTGVYMISSAMKPPKSISKPFSGNLVATDNKENATPPEPEMLTNRISKIQVKKEEPQPVTEFEPKQTMCNDMPPSPKLFGNYDFLK